MALRKPKITDIGITGCTAEACSFNIYFKPPPADVGIAISAYIKPHDEEIWSSLTISDPEPGEVWRVSAECMRVYPEANSKIVDVKLMFKTTDPFAVGEQKQSKIKSFKCSGSAVTPVIDHVDVYYCASNACSFHVYFKTLPADVDVQLYVNDVFMSTSRPVASGDLYRVAGQCTSGTTFAVQLSFQSSEGRTWSKRLGCNCVPGGGDTGVVKRTAPNIRDIDVYFCDDIECHFHVYFDPAPDGAEVEVYLDGSKVAAIVELSGGLSRIPLSSMKGSTIRVQLAFMTGVFRTYGVKVVCECALFAGMDTETEKVFSSNVKAVGWHRWLETHNIGSPYHVDRQWNPALDPRLVYIDPPQQLTADQVGILFVNEEISEEDARSRFRNLGYSDEDIEHLILLNAPY